MTRKFLSLLPLLLLLQGSASAQDALDVHAKIKFAGDKSTFRIGEPVRLILELTADAPSYNADVTPDREEPISDTISITPDTGVNRWLEELGGGYRDYSTIANLSQTPTRIEIVLNDVVRFDRAGHYSVRLTTRRIHPNAPPGAYKPALSVPTNDLGFDIEEMAGPDEEKEVKRISDLIDAAKGWQAEEAAASQLAYLTGDASTREKLRRFLAVEGGEGKSGNYYGQIFHGLFIARNRALIVQTLEAAIHDLNRPVTSGMLHTLIRIRLLQEQPGVIKPPRTGVDQTNTDSRTQQIHDAYVNEIAATLGRRSGKSQTITAMTVLMQLPKDAQSADAFTAEARRILLDHFDSLSTFDQEYLLRVKWDAIHDPSLIPALKKLLSASGVASKNIHDSALKRLIEMAPDEARPYVIAEIRDPKSLADREILGSLQDKELPEVDGPLLEQIRQLASSKTSFNRVFLQHKTALAARFASQAIYANLMDIYGSSEDQLPIEARPGFLAYFARHNETEGLGLLQQELNKLAPAQQFHILPDFTRLYFSDAVDTMLRKRLESDDQETASTAAYLISQHGSSDDEKLLELRLQRWNKEWGNRVAEADANLQGRLESELIMALTLGKSWKLPPEKLKELQRNCVTRICKQNFHVQ
jgi:hypothetical protein